MFDNFKIGNKMILLSGTILTLLLATLAWAIWGLSSTVANGNEVAEGNKLRGELLAREVDHLNWTKKVSAFLTDETITELTVQTDDTKCGFGKWLYGEGRQQAETLIPALSNNLKAVELPHKQLHEAAIKINKAYHPADPHLPQFLTAKELDHVSWVSSMQTAIIAGSRSLELQFDPTKCSFGKFLYGNAGKKAAGDNPELGRLLEQIKNSHEVLHQHGKEIAKLLAGGDQVGAAKDFEADVIPTLEKVRKLLHQAGEVASSALQGQKIAHGLFANEAQKSLADVQELLHSMNETVVANIMSDKEMVAAAVQTRTGISILGILALLLGCTIAYLITRSLTVPMRKTVAMLTELEKGHLDNRLRMNRRDEIGQMANTMDQFADSLQHEIVDSIQKLANGDLTFEITPKDQQDVIRGSLKKMSDDLNFLMGQIQVAGEQIASGSTQVSDSAQSLSQGATESAASLEEISSSMNEISAQTNQSADNANQANQLSTSARSAANTGSSRMAEMIAAMVEINNAGQNISKIIKVIDEIAFQTNLLALNAAVEAARAGQHGKGFAVVAEEVRNLAARSAKAASETAELIEGSVEKAQRGTQIAERTAASLEEIVSAITKVTDLIGEIAAAGTEQANGVEQVNIGLQQIDQVIQQSTANAEESAATSEELSSQAAELKNQLSHFVLKNALPHATYAQPAQISLPPASPTSGWGATPQQNAATDS